MPHVAEIVISRFSSTNPSDIMNSPFVSIAYIVDSTTRLQDSILL